MWVRVIDYCGSLWGMSNVHEWLGCIFIWLCWLLMRSSLAVVQHTIGYSDIVHWFWHPELKMAMCIIPNQNFIFVVWWIVNFCQTKCCQFSLYCETRVWEIQWLSCWFRSSYVHAWRHSPSNYLRKTMIKVCQV